LFSFIEALSPPLLGTTSYMLNFSDVASDAVLYFSEQGDSRLSFRLDVRLGDDSSQDALESSTEISV